MIHLYTDHRKVLLIDQNPFKQNLRATVLRNFEVEVHTAPSLGAAESLWRKNSYDLILLAAGENSDEAILLSTQIRQSKPRQRIGLLVGPPVYLQALGGEREKAGRTGKIASVPAAETAIEPVPSPQWQETVHKLVSNWYVDQSAMLG